MFLNRKKGSFLALLRISLQSEKKVPFSRFKVWFGKNAFQTILWFSKIGLDNFSMPILTA